jgi:hypothetical protein
MGKRALIIGGIVILVALLGVGGWLLLNPPVVRMVTMDGGGEVSSINLWDNHQTRGRVTGRAASGERVQLLQERGAGCQVETSAGQRGWVTCRNFIREFR